MNGAAALTETLRNAGVNTVFSLSGNQIMPVYDAAIDSGLRIVHTRHEAAAVYMADGWAQVTGELGVALVTAAPGFANAISALYTARMQEVPVLFLSGDSPVNGDGTGTFQELDQVAIAAPVVKHAVRVTSAETMGETIAEAIRIAKSGRPGPVHVALPFDVLKNDGGIAGTDFAPVVQSFNDAEAVLEKLNAAKRPLIVTGPTLTDSRAHSALEALRNATGAPVLPIESPRGLRDPALGAFPLVLKEADFILSIGKVLDFSAGFARPPALSENVPVIAIDPEAAALERAAFLCGDRLISSVQADSASAMAALTAAAQPVDRSEWSARVESALNHRDSNSDAGGRVHARSVGEAMQHIVETQDDVILCIDGGECGQWMQSSTNAKTRLINGLSGAIGGIFCYAIAAKIARPEATVIAAMGDGTVGFHLAEFETAAREKANIVAIVCNDALWNAEHQIQIRDYGIDRTYGCGILPDARYDQTAMALGCHGAHVVNSDDIGSALAEALAAGKPSCIDISTASLAAPVYTPFE